MLVTSLVWLAYDHLHHRPCVCSWQFYIINIYIKFLNLSNCWFFYRIPMSVFVAILWAVQMCTKRQTKVNVITHVKGIRRKNVVDSGEVLFMNVTFFNVFLVLILTLIITQNIWRELKFKCSLQHVGFFLGGRGVSTTQL